MGMRIRLAALVCLMAVLLAACGGQAASSVPESAPAPTTVPAMVQQKLTGETTRLVGRVLQDKGLLRLEWTNSGVQLRFYGTGIRLMVGTSETRERYYPALAVRVDGGAYTRHTVKTAGLVTLAEGLPEGEHTVEVYKVTEPTTSALHLGYVQMDSGQRAAALLEPPAAPERRIEFIGDSITCGYGNLGTSATKEFFTAQQDGLQTYASMTAEVLGADARYICMSGKGVVKNVKNDGGYTLPHLFTLDTPTHGEAWDFTGWTPDVVVINAGTNDVSGGATEEEFTAGALAFMQQVHAVYPDAAILWVYGMMNRQFHAAAEEAVKQYTASGGRAAYLGLRDVMLGEGGSAGHPNVKGHTARAELVTQAVRELMGW